MKIELNKFYNCDCMELMKQLPNESVDLIVTDPPYPVTSRGSSGNSGGMLQKDINKQGKVFNHNDIDCSEYAPEFYRILKEGSHCYVMTNHVNLIHMLNVFCDCGFHFVKSLIWDKRNKIMGQYYMSQFEYNLFFRKGYGKAINDCGTSDILSIPNKKEKLSNGENIHDTEKPVSLYQVLVKNSSKQEDLVLDPFSGVGGIGVACYRENRAFIGCEIDNKYFKLSNERLEAEKAQMRLFL